LRRAAAPAAAFVVEDQQRMRILNVTRGTELANDARVARRFWPRLVGLLGRSSLHRGEGLVIEPCRSVHTAFMRFAVDVVTVDRSGRVVKVVSYLKPFRLSATLRSAYAVVELPICTIAESGTAVGDQLAFRP
jgi:uncharacterized membrane protein (UPF0127 family)